MKSNKKGNNNILVALLFIIVVILIIYIIFFGGTANTDFYSDFATLQNNVSYYLGSKYTEMFGAYDLKNIMIGCNDEGQEIKNIDETNIVPIAIKDSLIEKDGIKYYKLNAENAKSILKVELPTYDNIEWYVCQDGQLRVKLNGSTPKWWNDSLESLKLS